MKVWIAVIGVLLMLLGLGYNFWQETHVTIGDAHYPLDLEELDLSGQAVPYVRELVRLPALKRLDLRDTGLSVEDYEYLRERLPDCEILWLVPFQGGFLPTDTRELTVTALDGSDMDMLKYLPELQTVHGMDCEDPEPLLILKAMYPQCQVRYRVPLEGKRWDWDTTALTLEGTFLQDLAYALPLLPMLETVTLSEPVEDYAAMLSLREAFPQIDFTYSLSLFGQTVPLDAVSLDFSGIFMGSTETVDAAAAHLPDLQTVDMCGCGIPDEEMAALNARWPDTLFVWEVEIGHFKLRTDITYFMPYQYRYVLSDKDADQLKYLTELICLDFGHMDISRTDYLAYMPKLQYLLMADTPITDLSPCANLKELKYAEFFMTDVKDFSPLLQCPNLVDLNVCYTYPKDPMIFAQMEQLENLWFRGMFDDSIIAQLKQALPNTRMVFRQGSSTGAGWRELPNYYAQRDIMGMWYMEG